MGSPQPQLLSVRIVSIDFYMAPPIPGFDISYSTFHGGKVNEVPVIRIYGSTPAGQKTCLHVHQVLPYLYVPCSDLGPMTNDAVDSRGHSISLALERALKLKGNAGSKRQHVHGSDLVRARKFYGYHSSEELFVKIYFYYPQDVSRAANLLLAGAILDKNLQPYESHIPFLLQFLIDYNLYGMGHLHVSKAKFRYPFPDAHSQRKFKHNGKLRQPVEESTCMDFQADLGGDLLTDTPIWTSSTIPDEWMWPYSSQPSSSASEDVPLFKRQCTSELEADALAQDIINQQSISYAPLSQTDSGMKMVQSLIPIWEEEYERNGVSEVMLLDPEKPLPQDVLRNLSDEVEFEKFMEENWSLSTPEPVESSTGRGDLIDFGVPILEESNHLPSNYSKASDKIGSLVSLDSPLQKVDTADTNVIDAVSQLQLSGSVGPSTPKDEDALRLLKWFASSQAAEDINSDDELAHQTILSPLLPSKDIDKVLERASVDYESESQKECQDILDSIVMLNVEEPESRAIKPAEYNHCRERLSNKFIPQVDGSSDDLQSSPCFDESLKTEHREAKLYVEGKSGPELDSNLVNKRQSKRPRWGSLPFISQKVSEVSHPNALCTSIVCNDQIKGLRTSSNWVEKEKIPHTDKKKDVSNMGKSSVIVECSSRDLMRKKRSCRIEVSENRSVVKHQKADLCSDVEFGRGVINLDSEFCNYSEDKKVLASAIHKPPIKNEATKSHQTKMNSTVHESNEAIDSKPTSSCFSVSRELRLLSSKDGIDADNLHRNGNPEGVVHADHNDNCSGEFVHSSVDYNMTTAASSCKPESSLVTKTEIISEDFGCRVLQTGVVGSCTVLPNVSRSDHASNTDGTSDRACLTSISDLTGMENETTSMQYENSPSHGRDSGLYKACDTSKSVNKEADTVKLIGISKKPLTIDSKDENESEAPALLGNGSSDIGQSPQGRSADVCLPCFESSSPEELQGDSPKNCEHVDNREPAMGVPILYKNDGSCLYMLTPAVSPPSRESVERWLSSNCPDIFRQKIDSPFLPASEGVSSDMMESQADVFTISQADDCKSSLPESASLSKEKPKLNQLPEHNKENCNMEGKAVTEAKKNLATGSSQDTSQISGPDKKVRLTPLSQTGFRDPASVGQGQQLNLLSIEVLAKSRGDLRPDPRFDAINVIVLVLQEDDESAFETYVLLRCDSTNVGKDLDAISDSNVFVFEKELQLLNHFTKLIHTSEPDVLMGWDVQSGSLGFLAERAAHLGVGLLNNISRTPSQISVASGDSGASGKQTILEIFSESKPAESAHLENTFIEDEWGRTHASGVHVGGRIVLNIWRLMRNEVKLNMYSVEAVAETVLRRKVPFIPWKVLTRWFSSGPGRARYRSIDYILERAKLNLQVMNQLDMINRTSELARVFGIDFFSVLSRGSQYRVESMFLRLAHSQNYLAISPGSQQVVNQPAMECLPLVMEPESNFYADPVIVLDFQSLYPSMVIAYNLCFCTCLGKVAPPKAQTLGVSSYSPDLKTLRNLKHELLVTPNGVVYVPSKVRKGILPRLLEEILSTRIMVKQAMKKLAPSQKVLHRILNARQLALKLISNVTYGYTAAGFSGRMPCAELADSIVQCGRRTLEAAISFVNSNDKWKARVIYGDTDSMFVLLKGRSLQEAFAVGHEIASEITKMNPSPVTLKMEKVYYPCFLLTKKRYVGYSYESPDQAKPTFDAKGTETIRRDTCVAVSKTMEQSLRIYFESQDIDNVKAYVLRQWTKIISGRFSLQDFVFAKEVRLGTYAANAYSLPPAAIVATKSMRNDPRAEPRYAERIPYVVIHGEPGARLVDMVVDPLELLALNSPYRLNDIYYIRKQIIPALQRVFGLVGADLNQWFLDMPRPARESVGKRHSIVQNPQKMRIDYYYASKHCVLCGDLVQGSAHLCPNCSKNETTVGIALTGRTSKLEKDIHHLAAICRHCGGGDWLIESGVKCTSLACSVFYERMKVQKELQSLSEVATRSGLYPKCMVEWF